MIISSETRRLSSPLRLWTAVAAVLVAALVVAGCDSQDLGDANPQTPSIVDIVTEVPALSQLEDGLTKANLVDDLSTDGPFTVFTPTNDAFALIEQGELSRQNGVLRRVLLSHVVEGEITAADISDGQTVETLSGETITFSTDGGVSVSSAASVTNPDVNASNGVVHVVDGVIADAVDRAALTPDFSLLVRLVERAGLTGALRGNGPDDTDGLTIFAPTDDAILAALDENGNGALDDAEIPPQQDLQNLLSFHVHDGEFSLSSFLSGDDSAFPKETSLSTLLGQGGLVLRTRTNDDGNRLVDINRESPTTSATITPLAAVPVENGVVYRIDTVLLPPGSSEPRSTAP